MELYKVVPFDELQEGQEILAFANHVVKWDFEIMGTPKYGIVPADGELDALRAELEKAKERERWIPVKERQPEPGKIFPTTSELLEVVDGGEVVSPAWLVLSGRFAGEWNAHNRTLINVTHWRLPTLPQPPA